MKEETLVIWFCCIRSGTNGEDFIRYDIVDPKGRGGERPDEEYIIILWFTKGKETTRCDNILILLRGRFFTAGTD